MNSPVKQHLIDPELCIRCYTCEVDVHRAGDRARRRQRRRRFRQVQHLHGLHRAVPDRLDRQWRIVDKPYTLAEQFGWTELPAQQEFAPTPRRPRRRSRRSTPISRALLAEAHGGAGGRAQRAALRDQADHQSLHARQACRGDRAGQLPPDRRQAPTTTCATSFSISARQPFPVLEGQSLGIIPPGARRRGQAASAAALFGLQPARRRAAEFQQCLVDGEARAGRRLLQLCLRSRRRATRSASPARSARLS